MTRATTPPPSPAQAWQAVLDRDRQFDSQFVYAVASTGVYCRPSCPSRKPARKHVSFFDSWQSAEQAGFRACRRCRPTSAPTTEAERRVEQARQYVEGHYDQSLSLKELGAAVGLSPSYLQRTFKQIVGLSPKEYRDIRQMDYFKGRLKGGDTVTQATYEAGFSSSSRLHDRVNSDLGMTPRVFQSGGIGMTLHFVTASTMIGRILVAMTERGIAAVRLGNSDAALVASLQRDYPKATLRRDTDGLKPLISEILQGLVGKDRASRLLLNVNGTAFQRKVWKALQRIPTGKTRSYRDIARQIGQPQAVRAVAHACARNPIALAIPCHRVLRTDGGLGGYRWGLERKRRLLALEHASKSPSAPQA